MTTSHGKTCMLRLGVDINNIKINTNKADRRVWKPDHVDAAFVLKGAETLTHLFWNCPFSSSLWSWLETLFNVCIMERNLKSLFLAGDTMSFYLKDLWIGVLWGGTKLIWHTRNKKTFEDHIITLDKEKRKWIKLLHDTAFLSKGCMNGEIKINTDGATRGNPGKGGIDCIFRYCKGNELGTLAKGIGLVTNYTAECQAIIHGVASAASNGWLIAWVESDSKAAVEAFN
ncbi:hypothetical protein GIB67_019230 [Kingdonia uniflora]|uniref:RNase H type-1 domain-containing protein n=1 Tax=Kingdonia uniflora TaxID=39325 RepID=A0A7J7MZU4_9MAGN|nr:hypothetical protein GIB67_019230 [Kingdonia uniflora]